MPRGIGCCVPGCNNIYKSPNIVFHRFPVYEEEQFNIWVQRIANEKLADLDDLNIFKSYYVCSDHFADSCKIPGSKRLKKYSLPTLNISGYVGNKDDSRIPSMLLENIQNDHYYCQPSTSRLQEPTISTESFLIDHCYAQASTSSICNIETEGYTKSEDDSRMLLETIQDEHYYCKPSTSSLQDEIISTKTIQFEHCYAQFSTSSVFNTENEASEDATLTSRAIYNQKSSKKSTPVTGLRKRSHLIKKLNLTSADLTPKKRKLYKAANEFRKRANNYRKKCVSFKQRLAAADSFSKERQFEMFKNELNKTTITFLTCQLRTQKLKARGRRYTLEEKVLALSLLKHSPKGYRLLKKLFSLPSRQRIMSLLKNIPFSTGINDRIISNLKNTVSNLNNKDKNCVILFDEISLKANLQYIPSKDIINGFQDLGNGNRKPVFADHATVFMVKGIRKRYKQPIAFTLCESCSDKISLKGMLKKVIRAVRSTGLQVIATISDQGQNNVGAIKELIKDTEAEYKRKNLEKRCLGYEIDEKEMIHLYDVPHLLKGVRNNLLTKDLIFNDGKEKIAKWDHIVKLFQLDQMEGDIKSLPHLTAQHVIPQKIKKMKVLYAAQVMSHRVAALMHMLAKVVFPDRPEHFLEPAAKDTADFLNFMDRLFDSCNGSLRYPRNGKYLRCAVTKTSRHQEVWNKSMVILNSIRFICPKTKKCKKVPSVQNWIYTLEGLSCIRKKLFAQGFEYIYPRNFNQDSLENFFGIIRSHGIRNVNPTCYGFVNSFKSILLSNFVSTHSIGANCEMDNSDGALDNLKNFIIDDVPILHDKNELSIGFNKISTSFVNKNIDSNFLAIESIRYVSGYILKTILKKTGGCIDCKKNVSVDSNSFNDIISAREYQQGCLHRPTEKFLEFFNKIINIFEQNIHLECYKYNVKKILINKIEQNVMDMYDCSIHKLLVCNIIIIFFIYTWVKNVNRILEGKIENNCDDSVKQLAQTYYNKHSKYNRN